MSIDATKKLYISVGVVFRIVTLLPRCIRFVQFDIDLTNSSSTYSSKYCRGDQFSQATRITLITTTKKCERLSAFFGYPLWTSNWILSAPTINLHWRTSFKFGGNKNLSIDISISSNYLLFTFAIVFLLHITKIIK